MSEPQAERTQEESGDVDGPAEARTPDPERIRDIVEREAAEAEADTDAEADAAAIEAADPQLDGPAMMRAFAVNLIEGGLLDIQQLLDLFGELVAQVQPFKDSPRHGTCPDCDGWGKVFSGSKLDGLDVIDCGRCNGQGYLAAELLAPTSPAPPVVDPSTPPQAALAAGPPEAPFRDPMTIPPEQGGAGAPGMDWSPQAGRWVYPTAAV